MNKDTSTFNRLPIESLGRIMFPICIASDNEIHKITPIANETSQHAQHPQSLGRDSTRHESSLVF
jgi:hypothetical protein